MATVPSPDTMRTSTTCAEERAARSAASGAPTRQRLSRQARVIFQEPGFRMQRGPSRSSRMASASSPPITLERAVPSAAPGTPSPAPQTVTRVPKRVSVRVGLMRKKLNTTSSPQTRTLMRPGVRASPVARSMAAYMPMAMVKGRAADQMAK